MARVALRVTPELSLQLWQRIFPSTRSLRGIKGLGKRDTLLEPELHKVTMASRKLGTEVPWSKDNRKLSSVEVYMWGSQEARGLRTHQNLN